jgi:hypothetical protein
MTGVVQAWQTCSAGEAPPREYDHGYSVFVQMDGGQFLYGVEGEHTAP